MKNEQWRYMSSCFFKFKGLQAASGPVAQYRSILVRVFLLLASVLLEQTLAGEVPCSLVQILVNLVRLNPALAPGEPLLPSASACHELSAPSKTCILHQAAI